MEMTLNQTAACTSTLLALATVGAVYGAVTVTSTAAAIALGIFAFLSAGAGIGSLTAWYALYNSEHECTSSGYFEKFKEHALFGVVGLAQYTAQILFQAVIEGFAIVVRDAVTRRLRGA